MGMGYTAEQVADEWDVSREDMDQFAYESHMKASAAKPTKAGYFKEEIVPFEFTDVSVGPEGPVERQVVFDVDEHLRPQTTVEGLGKLRPVFRNGGRVTAGNSSPLSDGAAGVIVMERSKAEALGLEPLARFVGFQVAGVRPEVMGVGPIKAVPKLLDRVGMSLDDIDIIELNEAFAAQALAVIRTLEMDPREGQRQRWGYRAWSSARLYRGQADRSAY